MKVQNSKKSTFTANSQVNSLIKAFDIENELPEPDTLDQSLQQVNVILELQPPDTHKIDKNVFECPEYWLSKGYQTQTGKIGFMIQQDKKKKRNE